MVDHETHDEDLMKEAVSLVRRIECRYPSRPEPSVAGFNAMGWLFIYLGSDPMYRFDEQGRLRRAFVDGNLLRTEGQTLARMQRQRAFRSDDTLAGTESTLLRHDLSPPELEAFRKRMRSELEELFEGLASGVVTRQHPADAIGLAQEIRQGIRQVLDSREFLAPAIVRR